MAPFNSNAVRALVNPKLIAANLTPEESIDAACIGKAMPTPSINLEQCAVNYFNITDKAVFASLLNPGSTILTISETGKPLFFLLPTACVPDGVTLVNGPPKTYIIAPRRHVYLDVLSHQA